MGEWNYESSDKWDVSWIFYIKIEKLIPRYTYNIIQIIPLIIENT